MKHIMQQLVMAVSFLAFTAMGADYVLKSGTTDWTKADSYEPSGNPGAGDTILLPANETFEVDAASASFATLSGVKRIKPASGSRLVLTVADGEKTLGCAFNNGGEEKKGADIGVLVKRGAGRLNLGSDGRIVGKDGDFYDYCTGIALEQGSLALVAEAASGRTAYGHLASSNDTTLVVSPGAVNDWAVLASAWCDGDIVNESDSAQRVISISSGRQSRIAGTVSGKIRFWNYGSVDYTATMSTFNGDMTAEGWDLTETSKGGVIGARTFGTLDGEASSLGASGNVLVYSDGGYRYLGTEPERTDKRLYTYGLHAFLDGGANGGLEWAGQIYNTTDRAATRGQHQMVFTGSGTALPNVFSGKVGSQVQTDTTPTADYSFYTIKRGAGTWRFTGAKNYERVGLNGGVAVEEGTLQFDTLLAAGRDCSLGTATRLTDGQTGLWSPEHMVGYAFALGSVASVLQAVFEYVGNGPAACSTRPIALVGKGATLRAESGALDFSGVSARDANSNPVLTLDGSSTAGNTVREITDGAAGAKVGIVKKGSGTWTLGGNFDVGGKVSVENGTLSIKTPRQPKPPAFVAYKWFRLTFAEVPNGSGGSAYTLNIHRISLFDKDGVRQNIGLTMAEGSFDGSTVRAAPEVKPGEVAYDSSMAGRNLWGGSLDALAYCFQSPFDSTKYFGLSQDSGKPITLGTPANWFSIVMHLKDEANPVTHFDVQGRYNKIQYFPTRLKMEGSVDGSNWVELWGNVEEGDALNPNITGWNQWISDGASASDDPSNRPLATSLFRLSATGEEVVQDPFTWFRLSIAEIDKNNADLDIRQIALFDKKGNRQNLGLTMAEGAVSATTTRTIAAAAVGPGQVAYDKSVAGYKVTPHAQDAVATVFDLTAAFTGLSTSDGCYEIGWKTPTGAELVPNKDKPETWIPIVMHLAPGAGVVTHFDIQALYSDAGAGSGSRHLPTRMKMEGSIDGVNWTELWSNVDDDTGYTGVLSSWSHWMSDDGTTSVRPLTETSFRFSKLCPDADDVPTYEQKLSGPVAVAAGSTFTADTAIEIAHLEIDAEGAGTLDGFAFAETGTLNVVNPKAGAFELPGTYANCTGLENLANWSVQFEGKAKRNFKIEIRDGKVMIVPPGMLLIVR